MFRKRSDSSLELGVLLMKACSLFKGSRKTIAIVALLLLLVVIMCRIFLGFEDLHKRRQYRVNHDAPLKLKNARIAKIPSTENTEAFSLVVYRKRDIVSQSLTNERQWEGPMTDFTVNSILKTAEKRKMPLSELLFLDIGANIGWFSFRMASLGVTVHAFEPMHANQQLIKASFGQNTQELVSRINLHETALSSTTGGFCVIYSDGMNVGDGILKCGLDDPKSFVPPIGYAVRGSVPVQKLDDFNLDTTRIAVKMDVEGHEGMILAGARKTLLEARIPLIVTEFSAPWIRATGIDPSKVLENLYNAGYRIGEMSLDDVKEKYLNTTNLNDLAFECEVLNEHR